MKYSFKPFEITLTALRKTNEAELIQRVPSGVAVFHKPTGQQFSCEEHRSQHKNKNACLDMLEEYLQSSPPQQTTQDSHFAKLMKTVVDLDRNKCIMVPEEVESEEDFIKWIDGLD